MIPTKKTVNESAGADSKLRLFGAGVVWGPAKLIEETLNCTRSHLVAKGKK